MFCRHGSWNTPASIHSSLPTAIHPWKRQGALMTSWGCRDLYAYMYVQRFWWTCVRVEEESQKGKIGCLKALYWLLHKWNTRGGKSKGAAPTSSDPSPLHLTITPPTFSPSRSWWLCNINIFFIWLQNTNYSHQVTRECKKYGITPPVTWLNHLFSFHLNFFTLIFFILRPFFFYFVVK